MDKDNKDVNIEPEIVDLEQRAHKAGRPATSWADLEGMVCSPGQMFGLTV